MSTNLIYFLLTVLVLSILFVVTHLKPLTEFQIKKLARKRRKRTTRKYFRYFTMEYLPNLDFKKSMSSIGNFYPVNYRLYDAPSIIASLLKYKKHEWIVVAFEKNKIVDKLWLNKGLDKYGVGLNIPLEIILNMALAGTYSSVIICHNHPNPNPRKYSNTLPSKKDKESAKEWGEYFNIQGVNLIEFVCERGKPYRYFKSYSEAFLPVAIFSEKILMINGKSRWSNLRLHIERFFTF